MYLQGNEESNFAKESSSGRDPASCQWSKHVQHCMMWQFKHAHTQSWQNSEGNTGKKAEGTTRIMKTIKDLPSYDPSIQGCTRGGMNGQTGREGDGERERERERERGRGGEEAAKWFCRNCNLTRAFTLQREALLVPAPV